MEITRTFEFDAAHRLNNHKGRCRNIHGHRYKLELTLEGKTMSCEGESEEGMLLDFSDIKVVAGDFVDDLDHAFLVAENDQVMRDFLHQEKSKHVVVPGRTTAENLVQFMADKLQVLFADTYNDSLQLKRLQLWETPNCSAIWRSE